MAGDVQVPIGQLRTRVTLQTPQIVKDAGGAQSTTWSELATVWARWIHAHGPEVITSDAVTAMRRATVTVRYLQGVSESCAVLLNGERWQVISVDDIGQRHCFLELIVERVKGSS